MSKIIEEITSPSITFTKLEAFFYFGVLSLVWGCIFFGIMVALVTGP